MREPVRDTGGDRVAAHETVDRPGGERDGVLVRVAADPHKQRVHVTQRDPPGELLHLHPRLDRVLHQLGDRDLPPPAALAAHEQPVVPAFDHGRLADHEARLSADRNRRARAAARSVQLRKRSLRTRAYVRVAELSASARQSRPEAQTEAATRCAGQYPAST